MKKDLHSQQLRFPFAVDMKKPLRYKIKEFSMDGEIVDKGWNTMSSWMGVLDITSQTKDIKSKRRNLEFEVDLEDMKTQGILKYDVHMEYVYLGYNWKNKLSFASDESIPIKECSILMDIDTDIKYTLRKTTDERRYSTMKRIVPDDDYIFINMEK